MEATAAPSNLHLQPHAPRLVRHVSSPLTSTASSSLFFKLKPPLVCSIKASSSSSSSVSSLSNFTEAVKPVIATFIRSTCVVAVAAVALVMAGLGHRSLPAIAAPLLPMVMEKESGTGVLEEEKERNLEDYLNSHPDDVEALRSLMDVKIKSNKLQEAIDVIDRLIQIQPDEKEWRLMKGQIYIYREEYENARAQFEELLANDPLSVEAYHGLVMSFSKPDRKDDLKEVLRRIEQAMDVCKKEKKKDDLRDFKLLIAQIRVTEGEYNKALKVYQELVKEEPRDFRPYLCQGMIYTLLKKSDEAEKCFQKYKRLVPKAHPYAQFFDDNMIATKLFSQKVGREAASSKS